VLLDAASVRPYIIAADVDHATVEVDAEPSECENLGPTHAGDHDQPDEGAPVVVLVPGSGDDPRCLGRGWRVGVGRPLPRLAGDARRVRLDPAPPHGGRHGAANGDVHLPDRCRGQWRTHVRLALGDLATHRRAVVLRIAGSRTPTRRTAMLHDATLVWPV